MDKRSFERQLLLKIFDYIKVDYDYSNITDLYDYFLELDKKDVEGSFFVRIYYLNSAIFDIEIENFCDVVKKTIYFEKLNQTNLWVVAKIDWLIDKKILLGLFYRTLKKYRDGHFF